MESALLVLVALACPLGMGLCMWMMARGMRGGSDKQESDRPDRPSVAELRAERDRLTAEVARAEGDTEDGPEALGSEKAPIGRA